MTQTYPRRPHFSWVFFFSGVEWYYFRACASAERSNASSAAAAPHATGGALPGGRRGEAAGRHGSPTSEEGRCVFLPRESRGPTACLDFLGGWARSAIFSQLSLNLRQLLEAKKAQHTRAKNRRKSGPNTVSPPQRTPFVWVGAGVSSQGPPASSLPRHMVGRVLPSHPEPFVFLPVPAVPRCAGGRPA